MPDATGSITLPARTLDAEGLQAAVYTGDIEFPEYTLSGSLEGPKALPARTLSGVLTSGVAAQADIELPSRTMSGTMLTGSVGVGAALRGGYELNATTGTRGNLRRTPYFLEATGVTGTASKGGRKTTVTGQIIHETNPRLPARTLEGSMLSQGIATGDCTLPERMVSGDAISGGAPQGDITLPERSLAATGISGTASAGDVVLLERTLVGRALNGGVANGELSLPSYTLAGTLVPPPSNRTGVGAVVLPEFQVSGVALNGGTITATITLPAFTLAGEAHGQGDIDGDITLAARTLSGTAISSGVAVGAVRRDEYQLSATAVSGNVGTAAITLPLYQLSAQDGVLLNVGTANIVLPLYQLSGLMQQAVALSDISFTGITLNTRTKAVTNYEGMAPNSVASFAGVTLLATADGIVALAGENDAGAPIEAHMTLGVSDLGHEGFKRVLTGYVGYRSEGDMELTLITDGHHEHSYTLVPRRATEQHASRVKFGRGVAGMYWQVKVENTDGCDFSLDRLELQTAATGAKV